MLLPSELRIDQKVVVPGFKKRKPAPGTITWVGHAKGVDAQGNEFVWVTVRGLDGKEQNWPSSRLGKGGSDAT